MDHIKVRCGRGWFVKPEDRVVVEGQDGGVKKVMELEVRGKGTVKVYANDGSQEE